MAQLTLMWTIFIIYEKILILKFSFFLPPPIARPWQWLAIGHRRGGALLALSKACDF